MVKKVLIGVAALPCNHAHRLFSGDQQIGGIFRIPAMINPAGLDISLYGFLICMTVALVVSAIGAFIVTDPDEGAQETA